MTDFAATTMLRLIKAGLARQGHQQPNLPNPRGARVPLHDKRALLSQLLADFGPTTILRIGEAFEDLHKEPAHLALSLARNPVDLLSRWQRLERYVHSRHRTRILEAAGDRLVLEHFSQQPSQPPSAAEDLVVFGLLVALMEFIGLGELKARPLGAQPWYRKDGRWRNSLRPTESAIWEIHWHSGASGHRARALSPPAHDWASTARRLIEADPGRGWSLPVLAAQLQSAPRSLQRRLKEEATSFSALLAETRAAVAARLLNTTDCSLAEIGYVCGYSDQAHFTREFKRAAAVPPAAYREAFAQGCPQS